MTMDSTARRQLLATEPSIHHEQDFLLALKASVGSNNIILNLYYVPDRELIAPHALEPYLAQFSGTAKPLQHVAADILEDMVNVLIPRYILVEITQTDNFLSQQVRTQESRPKWENAHLLSFIPAK